MMKLIKWLRVLVALSIFSALTWYLVIIDKEVFDGDPWHVPNVLTEAPDDTIAIPTIAGHWFARIQLTQTLLAGTGIAVAMFVGWVVFALLFGRVYCSAICPFGVLQDMFSRVTKLIRGKKRKFQFRKAMTKTRLTLFVVFVIGLLAVPVFVTILDPYSNFARIVTSKARPVYRTINHVLAKRDHDQGNYDSAFYSVANGPRATHPPVIMTGMVALLLVGTLSVLYGRRYCNTLCPVGTFLGLLSRFSYFKVRLKDGCKSCGLCAAACKGECIDAKNKTVDSSRCVACFNCLSTCRQGLITFAPPLPKVASPASEQPQKEQQSEKAEQPQQPAALQLQTAGAPSPQRRRFLHWSVFSLVVPTVAGILIKKSNKATAAPDPGLPQGKSAVGYEKTAPILPPGAGNVKYFQSRCTGCHLCVSKCPAGIIKPSVTELGLSGFMQPVIDFEHGFCDYNCNLCSQVCPSNALRPIEVAERQLTRIGKAVFIEKNCVVHTNGENCAACDEHCSPKAIKMVPYGDPSKNLVIPQIDDKLCIGCGGCEHICPVRPYRAIYVDGLTEHEKATPAYDPNAKQEDLSEEIDFPF
jgi:Polyferredoxin